MAALAVASVSRTCFVPIQETALGPCHRGGCQRCQPSAGRLTPQHVCTLNARRAWKRRTLVKDNVVVASSSQENVSTTDLSEAIHGDDASPNYELLLMVRPFVHPLFLVLDPCTPLYHKGDEGPRFVLRSHPLQSIFLS